MTDSMSVWFPVSGCAIRKSGISFLQGHRLTRISLVRAYKSAVNKPAGACVFFRWPLPYPRCRYRFCKARNPQEMLVSFGIISIFADILKGGQTIRHLLVEYLFPNLLLYARPSISVTYKFVVEWRHYSTLSLAWWSSRSRLHSGLLALS